MSKLRNVFYQIMTLVNEKNARFLCQVCVKEIEHVITMKDVKGCGCEELKMN
jgi:hypothetical protein